MKLSIISFVNHFAFAERIKDGMINFHIMRKNDYIQIQGVIDDNSFSVLMKVGVKAKRTNYDVGYAVEFHTGHAIEFEESVTSTGRPLYDLAKCLEKNAYILGELKDGIRFHERSNRITI